jgi:hypothetical protein
MCYVGLMKASKQDHPDEGKRNCSKHIEFLDKINLGNWYVCWFYYKEIGHDARSHERKIIID